MEAWLLFRVQLCRGQWKRFASIYLGKLVVHRREAKFVKKRFSSVVSRLVVCLLELLEGTKIHESCAGIPFNRDIAKSERNSAAPQGFCVPARSALGRAVRAKIRHTCVMIGEMEVRVVLHVLQKLHTCIRLCLVFMRFRLPEVE